MTEKQHYGKDLPQILYERLGKNGRRVTLPEDFSHSVAYDLSSNPEFHDFMSEPFDEILMYREMTIIDLKDEVWALGIGDGSNLITIHSSLTDLVAIRVNKDEAKNEKSLPLILQDLLHRSPYFLRSLLVSNRFDLVGLPHLGLYSEAMRQKIANIFPEVPEHTPSDDIYDMDEIDPLHLLKLDTILPGNLPYKNEIIDRLEIAVKETLAGYDVDADLSLRWDIPALIEPVEETKKSRDSLLRSIAETFKTSLKDKKK